MEGNRDVGEIELREHELDLIQRVRLFIPVGVLAPVLHVPVKQAYRSQVIIYRKYKERKYARTVVMVRWQALR